MAPGPEDSPPPAPPLLSSLAGVQPKTPRNFGAAGRRAGSRLPPGEGSSTPAHRPTEGRRGGGGWKRALGASHTALTAPASPGSDGKTPPHEQPLALLTGGLPPVGSAGAPGRTGGGGGGGQICIFIFFIPPQVEGDAFSRILRELNILLRENVFFV